MQALLRRPFVFGWELRHAIESLAQQIAARYDRAITITWTASVPTAAVGRFGDMYLSAVRDDAKIARPMFVRYVGYVIHEVLHLVYTDFRARDGGAFIDRLHNAVEDIWIERRGIDARATGNIEAVLTALIGQMISEAQARVADWSDPAQYPFLLAVHGRRYAPRLPLPAGLEPIFDEASRRIDAAASSTDTLEIARWVAAQLQSLPDNPQPDQPGEQGEEGEDQPGEPCEDGEPGEEGEEGEEGESDKPGNGKKPGPARRPQPGTIPAEVEPSVDVDPKDRGVSMDVEPVRTGRHMATVPVRAVTPTVPARLRMEIRRIFDNSGTTLFAPGRKSGSLNVRSLHRAGFDDRVFQRRTDVDGIDASVMLVLDVSGSMGYHLNLACDAAWSLLDSLLAAEVKCGILTFDHMSSIAAPVGASRSALRSVLERVHDAGSTDCTIAMRLATDLMLPRQEARRAIFVLTDGEGNTIGKTRVLAEAAVRLGITVIGVGIRADVSHIYPNAVRVDNLPDLGTVMCKQIKLAA